MRNWMTPPNGDPNSAQFSETTIGVKHGMPTHAGWVGTPG